MQTQATARIRIIRTVLSGAALTCTCLGVQFLTANANGGLDWSVRLLASQNESVSA